MLGHLRISVFIQYYYLHHEIQKNIRVTMDNFNFRTAKGPLNFPRGPAPTNASLKKTHLPRDVPKKFLKATAGGQNIRFVTVPSSVQKWVRSYSPSGYYIFKIS